MSSPHSNPDPPAIDWEMVRQSFRRRFAGQLDRAERSAMDDLVQEGCIRLLRVSRKERIDDLEALVTVVARRTFRDYLRRRYRHERLWKPLDDSHADVPDLAGAVDASFGDLIDRIEFMVLEIFTREDRPDCGQLARAWFAKKNWKELAAEVGIAHASVRKRWSRCLELPRKVLRADPDFERLFGEK